MSDVVLRPAQAEDEKAALRVIEAAYSPWVGELTDMPDVAEGLDRDIEAGKVTLAQSGGRVAGVLVAACHQGDFHLQNVAVSPDMAGQGIGRRLIARAEMLARDAGCPRILLATHRGIPRNIALYRHLGWEILTERGNKVLMQKRLSG